MELILASGSPRRREMLDLIGLKYSVRIGQTDESIQPCAPEEMVVTLAARKARTVKAAAPGCCVIGADTIVYLDGQIIGKPRDPADAVRILRSLSGRTHTVYTGVCIATDEEERCFYEATYVTFAQLSDDEIQSYVASGEPMDKAGAYGVQGIAAVFVEKIEGCYFNVIGLPVPTLYRNLAELHILPQWRK